MSDAIEAAARAIYEALPNYGMAWQPNTRGGHSQVRVDDTWDEAPDRHEDCRRQARAALTAYEAAKGGGVDKDVLDLIRAARERFDQIDCQGWGGQSVPGMAAAFDLMKSFATDGSRILSSVIGMVEASRALTSPASGSVIETRNDEAGFVEFINEDVPTVVRDLDGPAAILLDLNTRKVVGYRVYDPSPASGERDAVIEECARVAEAYEAQHPLNTTIARAVSRNIADNIRAMLAAALRMEGK